MSSSESYSYEYFNVSFPAEYVAHVEINRPQKLNAFMEVMWLELRKIFLRLSTDPNVRSVLLTGAGRAFCAGLDVQAASQGGPLGSKPRDPARAAKGNIEHIYEFQECITAIERCSKPVIVVLHGIAYGLAIDISAACDIRFCTSDARFSVKEVDIGIAADIGTLSRLPKIVGSFSWVKDVTLTARVFGAEEALRVGFVSEVVGATREEGYKAGLEKCKSIAEKSPVAVWGTKEILNYSRDRPVEEGLRYTAIWNGAMLQTEDIKSALLSGIQKRSPKFSKL